MQLRLHFFGSLFCSTRLITALYSQVPFYCTFHICIIRQQLIMDNTHRPLPHLSFNRKRGAVVTIIGISLLFSSLLFPTLTASAATATTVSFPWNYTFSSPGTLNQTATEPTSGSAYWWVSGGGQLIVNNGLGKTLQGDIPSSNPWNSVYAKSMAVTSDNGIHPQNIFSILLRTPSLDTDQSVSVQINKDNLANPENRDPWNGIHLISRWQDGNNYYFAGIRNDGHVIIKKKVNGLFYTLAEKTFFGGIYNATTNPSLLPKNTWINLRKVTSTDASGNTRIQLYIDQNQSGTWTLALDTTDTGVQGVKITTQGLSGIRSDFIDMSMDNFKFSVPPPSLPLGETPIPSPTPVPVPAPSPSPSPTPTPTPTPNPETGSYDSLILSDNPVMFFTMANAATGKETDLTLRGHTGTYRGGIPTAATLPNGDNAADFNGSSQYLTVPSSSDFSVPTTRELTWEAWIRPDQLQFPNDSGYGYIDWMGKCQDYGPTCEWEARMYSTTNPEGRTNRLSAYIFNPSAGLGSAADWQPNAGLVKAGQWIHVVGQYQTITTPSGCNSAYPGSINIWVNGIKWSQANHMPTGCMSQFKVVPKANDSPLNIGTMAMETWFPGAIGKVAIYNRLLTQAEITEHFQAMTGNLPTGSCAESCSF
jgi:hypothetical protein